MKKLNEAVLRKLILETIEEDLFTEGRKKKIKEAEPVQQPTPVDTSGDRPQSGMNNPDFDMSDTEAAAMMPSFSDEQINQAHEVLDQAFALAKSNNPMLSGSPEDMIKQIVKMFKGEA